MSTRAIRIAIALTLLVNTVASALEFRSHQWSFDGKAVPGRFNLLSILVYEPGPRAFDGEIALIEGRGLSSAVGAPLVQQIYVTPGTERWVQFVPFIVGDYGWTIRWGRGEKENGKLDAPNLGPPGTVLLVDSASPFIGEQRLKGFASDLFPTSVAATDALDQIAIDHVPRWDAPRREAFMDWVRRGGVVHLLRSPSGLPIFDGDLAPLNTTLTKERVGAGTICRHHSVLIFSHIAARHGVKLKVSFLGFSDEFRIFQGRLKGLPESLHPVFRRSRWKRIKVGNRADIVQGHLDQLAAHFIFGKADGQWHIGQLRMRGRGILQNDFHLTRVQLLAPGDLDRRPREPAKARDLTGIDGQTNLRRPLVAGNNLHRQAERFLQDHRVVVGRRAGRRRAHFDERGRAQPFLGAVDPAGLRHHAGIVVFNRRADVFELARIKLDPLPARELMQDQGADPVSQGQAVGLGLPVKIVGADEKTRSPHIFHDKCRIAGNMLAYVTGEHAGVCIEPTARRSRHDQANRLTLVKILCRHHAGPTNHCQQYQR